MRASLGDTDESELQYVIDGLNGGEAKFEAGLAAALVSVNRLQPFSELSICVMHIDDPFSNVGEHMFELSVRNDLDTTGELGIDELVRMFDADEISLVEILTLFFAMQKPALSPWSEYRRELNNLPVALNFGVGLIEVL